MAKLLSRAGLALGLLVPLLLAACGPAQAAERADSANGARTAPFVGTSVDGSNAATRTKMPSAVLDDGRATPSTSAATPMVPDFRLPDLDGKTWTLSQFRARPVMLYFWATW